MRSTSSLLIALTFLIITTSAYTKALDQKDVIHIMADSWNYNRKTGISIFLGPVKIDQGSTHITAAKVITKQTDDKHMEEMTAFGDNKTQAHYWDTKTINESALHAYAGTIHYLPTKSLITLKENAHIQQGKNHFKGNLIYYNMNDQTIMAPKTPNSRTTIIYQPS